jgi:hypothetical protein
LTTDIVALNLQKVAGQDISALTREVIEKARQIEGSGCAPTDLQHLVAQPFTTGSDELFKSYAMGIYNSVIGGTYTRGWQQMVQEMDVRYQDLLQRGLYTPAIGKKDDDAEIHAMIGKVVDANLKKKLDGLSVNGDGGRGGDRGKRKCFNCGSEAHLVRECPQPRDSDPRYVPPSAARGEAKERTRNGKEEKWCGRCRGGKGVWTSGNSLHTTEEHRGRPAPPDNANPPGAGAEPEAEAEGAHGHLGVVDAGLSFTGFLGVINHPKGGHGRD